MTTLKPRDPAVEYGIVLTNGATFYTGGFDEPPSRSNMRWEAGISGAFSDLTGTPWHITYINADHIVAVVDYRPI